MDKPTNLELADKLKLISQDRSLPEKERVALCEAAWRLRSLSAYIDGAILSDASSVRGEVPIQPVGTEAMNIVDRLKDLERTVFPHRGDAVADRLGRSPANDAPKDDAPKDDAVDPSRFVALERAVESLHVRMNDCESRIIRVDRGLKFGF